jgi:hypothetical protein
MGVKYFCFFFFSLFLIGCAQVRPLEGGAKDEQAPIPNMLKASPAMGSTNVRPSIIRIPFDEYIKLINPSKNINVVPELITKPKFEVKGRDLIISINGAELLDNTTYSFVFNQAISDLNEGNDTTFTYVFSTGQYIDSLSHEVLLINAETLSPVANAMVGLFLPTDSLDPYVQKPRYVAPTNKQGYASFEYLGQQDFVVFAYDLQGSAKISTEAPIAFRSEYLNLDTLRKIDTLFMFVPEVSVKKGRILNKRIDFPGRIGVRTNFSFMPQDVLIQSGGEIVDYLLEETAFKDSAVFWIIAGENTNYDVFIPFRDTMFNAKVSTRKLTDRKMLVSDNLSKGELGINDTLKLIFEYPLLDWNEALFKITQGDEVVNEVAFVLDQQRNLLVVGDFLPDLVYQVSVLPNAIRFYDDALFTDSIQVSFKKLGSNKYSNLELVLEDKPATPMVIQLISNGAIVAERTVSIEQESLIFQLLPPGEYVVRVVLDENENGKWDTGSWLTKQQPETIVWFRQSFTLRANWDTKQPLGFQ